MKQDKTMTPETDEAVFYTEQKTFCDMVVSDFARRLERERDEARKHAQFWRNVHCEDEETVDKNLFPWEK